MTTLTVSPEAPALRPRIGGLVAESVFAGLVGIVDHLAGRVELDPFLLPWAWKNDSLEHRAQPS